MVEIPAGSFWMGSPEDEEGRGDDEDLHRVTLTHRYCLATTEVRYQDWDAWMDQSVGYFDDCGEDCPIESVSWHQAAAFTNVLSDEEGLERCYECEGSGWSLECSPAQDDPYTCRGYRLPTEAEWERAARAGGDDAFPEGGEIRSGEAYLCREDLTLSDGEALGDQAWWCGNAPHGIEPTAWKDANPWGLHDMRGNVYEWCHDGYDDYEGDATDPSGPRHAERRVLRGGSFAVDAADLRAAARSSADPDSHLYIHGFRVARSLD
jgi:formylglycine-generating enzyme required for sulfatase activity